MAQYYFYHLRWQVIWPDQPPSAPMTPVPVREAPTRVGSPLTPIKEQPEVDLTCDEEMEPVENLLNRFNECDETLVIE